MLAKEKIIEIAKDCDKPTGDAFLDDLHAKYNEGSPREDQPHYYRFLYKLAPYLETYMELGFHYGSALHHIVRGNPTCKASGADSDTDKFHIAATRFPPLKFSLYLVSSKSFVFADKFADSSFDAILIDTDHTYETTEEEFSLWSPKVKSGGVILFDDIDAPEYADGCGKFFRELAGEKVSLPQLHPDNWGFGVWFKP